MWKWCRDEALYIYLHYCEDMMKLKNHLFSKADQNIKEAQTRRKRDYDKINTTKYAIAMTCLKYGNVCMLIYYKLHNIWFIITRSFNQELWYYCATMPEMGRKGTSWPSNGLGLTWSQNTFGRECIDCLIASFNKMNNAELIFLD